MPNLATILKQEITRLARKELRAELGTMRKQTVQYRRDIAALKRQVDAHKRELAFLGRQEKKRLKQEPSPDNGQDARFSPHWLKMHRQRLSLSAKDYARLVGASELSIYRWEQGKTNPRPPQRIKLSGIRGLGKREAIKRLEMMGG
jgi:DNA-binding transcriptional regulator YiaG